MTMIGCSMAYNMVEQPKRKALLRRFDHAAIFLMIAGTYTPFTTIRFDGAWAISMTTIVWALADRRRRQTLPARHRQARLDRVLRRMGMARLRRLRPLR
jgi:channel protein (hemolysin III family)